MGQKGPLLDTRCHTVTRAIEEALFALDTGELDQARQLLRGLLASFEDM
jgi:hypothetical protein